MKNNKNYTEMKPMKITLIALLLFGTIGSCQKLKPFPDDEEVDKSGYEYLEEWQEGYLDIHQISTGRGNCTFMILPDGTTFMVDAGDLGDGDVYTQEIMPAVPSPAKRPAEWIAQYVKHFSEPLGNDGKIDYMLVTHFDADHIGKDDRLAIAVAGKNYKLTGVTHLAQLVGIETLLDRGYPDYDYPTKDRLQSNNTATFPNYYKYIQERDDKNMTTQKFAAGANNQITLLNKPSSYSGFEIRNLLCNGTLWSGSGDSTRELFPAISTLASSAYPNENRCSCAFMMHYGKFDYFSGGDILGVANNPAWYDMETPVGNLIGETDVVLCNHHAYSDAMNTAFVKAVKAQAFIIPVWDYYHPQPDPLARMLDQSLYIGDRYVFAAGLVGNNRIRLGENGDKIKPDGHIVVRVYPGGDDFQVFVLNDRSQDYEVIHKTEKLQSK